MTSIRGGKRARTGLVGVMVLSLFGCANSTGDNQCTDGIDNDDDGLFDLDDPGCIANGTTESPDPDFPACSDGVDNDGDSLTDYPDDPGCDSAEDDDEYNAARAQCNDGIDNDNDGRTDYPYDPGCFLPLEDDETDDCPDGPDCPACSNGQDDDDDGLIDYGAAADNDPGCDRAADDDEFNADPGICGNVEVKQLPADGIVTGTISGATNELISPTCSGAGPEAVFQVELEQPTALYVTTDFAETTLDTVVYVRSECRTPTTEIGCNDDDEGVTSTLQVEASPGVYYIIIDTHSTGASGDFKAQVISYIPQGEPCDPDTSVCAPGLVCRMWDDSSTQETCEYPRCSDGADNDGDELTDYPADPGCANPDDNDETDDCPDGPDCPQCANGVDDDGDELIDYPADPGCVAASDDDENDCPEETDPIYEVVSATTSGTTTGLSNDLSPSCSSYSTAPEQVYLFKSAGQLVSLTVDTEDSTLDTILYVKAADCASPDLDCDDDGGVGAGDSLVELTDLAAGNYFIVVDGYSSNSGDFQLNLHGVIAGGEPCDADQVAAGMFECDLGYECNAGSCTPTVCNNGEDDDDDGLIDFPYDPGCDSVDDSDESDHCPNGGTCPECGNQVDDDEDGLIDFGEDPGCASASDDIEDNCGDESDPIVEVSSGTMSGTTAGLTDDFAPSCGSAAGAPEAVYTLTVPGTLDSLTLDTNGSDYDTILYLRANECSTPVIDCDDDGGDGLDSLIELTDVAPDVYYLYVDGSGSSSGSYTLNVSGVIADGEACDAAQVAAGIFSCSFGYACSEGVCAPAACNDGEDSDGDTLIDYPDDPGCSSPSDDDETDACPDGPTCPACSNGVDDDDDSIADYPDDPGCSAASDNDETDCEDSDPVVEFVTSPTTGTTSGATNDISPSCSSSSNAPDVILSLTVPGDLTSLTIDAAGSSYDTVMMLQSECGGSDLACNDDDPNDYSTASLLELGALSAGTYFIVVDGYSSYSGAFQISVDGVIAAGQPCDPAQTFFTCGGGTSCTDSGSGFTCN